MAPHSSHGQWRAVLPIPSRTGKPASTSATVEAVLLTSAPSRVARLAGGAVVAALALAGCAPGCTPAPFPVPEVGTVIVFTRTEGFVHGSIGPASDAIEAELAARGHPVLVTDDPAVFSDSTLGPADAVVFLSTTGDV